jgi:fibronectin-binding autotransporter adhesin
MVSNSPNPTPMNLVRPTLWKRATRTLPILGTSIAALLAPPAQAALSTWNAFGAGPFNWTDNANWVGLAAPAAGDATLDVVFPGGAGSTVTNNDFTGLFLNSLTFQGGAAETVSISGNLLDMRSDGAVTPTITQSGAGAVTISAPVALTNALTLNGGGAGIVTMSGVVSGTSLLSVASGNWRLTGTANTWTGGTTITGGVLELAPAVNTALNIPATTNSPIGNTGAITLNGGELKLTTSGTGVIQSGNNTTRPITFGTGGGTLNVNGIMSANTAATFTITLPSSIAVPNQPAVIKFNGGTQGTSNAAGSDWVIGGNTLRIGTWTNLNANNPVRIELTNGAMMQWGGNMNTFASPLTIAGVIGGDPSATTNEKTVGRAQLDSGPYNFTNGLTVEGVFQISTANGLRQINGNIAVNNGGALVVSGRGTGTAVDATNSSRLEMGSAANSSTITVNNGGLFVTELRNRYESANQFGVRLNDRVVLKPGGSMRATQSWMGASPTGTDKVVGWAEYIGDIEGQGSSAAEAVFDLRLGPATTAAPFNNQNGVTFGNHAAGGALDAAAVDLVVNGSGFGGLRINTSGRITKSTSVLAPNPPMYLFGSDGSTDPVTTETKINNLLTVTRLNAVSGSGGYLTPAPSGLTYNFPAGGEWAAGVTVGLKAVDHNPGGADVSLSALTTWGHHLAVDAGATLDLGAANPFSLTAGTLHGSGTVSGTGSLQINSGANVSPGLGGLGALTVGNLALDGSFLLDVSSAPSIDLLNAGNLTLGASSVLSVNGGSTFNNGAYTLATYSGTLAGTFGSVSGLPAGYAVDYATPGVLRLVFTLVGNKIWNGTPGTVWSTNSVDANWQGGLPFVELDNVTFDDTAAGSKTVTVSGIVSPSSMTVNTGATYILNGSVGNAVGGSGALQKIGAGTLELNGSHSYSGGTTVNEGTLRVGSDDSLPNLGTVSIALGATLDLNGKTDTVSSLILNGTITAGNLSVGSLAIGSGVNVPANLTLTGNTTKTGAASTISGNVNLGAGNRSVDVAPTTAPELTIAGIVSNGSLTKTGNGTLSLTNSTNAQTSTTVNGGTLRAEVAGAIPTGSDAATGAGGTLNLNSLPHTLNSLVNSGTTATGGASLNLSSLGGLGTGSLQMGGGLLTINQTGTGSYSGAITGTGTQVIKLGSGVQGLTGASTYTGGLDIQAGRVNASGGGGGTGGITVNPGTGLQLVGNLTGNVTASGATVSAAVDMTNAISGNFNIAGNTLIHLNNEDNSAQTGDFAMTGTLRGTGNLDVSIIATAGADNLDGFRLRGTGASDYSGVITLGPRVKFELQSTTAGNFSPMGTGSIVATAGTATGTLNGTYTQIQTRVNTASLSTNFGNNVTISGSGVVNFNIIGAANTTSTFGNLTIGGGQSAFFNKNDNGIRTVVFPTVSLTGGNATFSVWDPSFGSTTTDSVGPSVQLGAIGELTPGAGVIFKGSAATSATVVPRPHVSITGTAGYTGPTDIETGILTVAATGSLASSSRIEISAGARLDVVPFGPGGYTIPTTQTVNGAGVWDGRIVLDGTLAPGFSVGERATVSGEALTLNGLGVMQMNLSQTDNTSDRLTLTGAFTKGTAGGFLFDFEGGGLADTTYTLVQFTSTDFLVSDFSYTDLAPGLSGTFTLTSTELLFTVPEPGSAMLLLGGLAMLGMRRRKRK